MGAAEAVCNAIAEQGTPEATRGGRANLNDMLAVVVIGSGVGQDER